MSSVVSLPAPSFLEEVAGATAASPNVFGLLSALRTVAGFRRMPSAALTAKRAAVAAPKTMRAQTMKYR